ncbi:hypothetical protein DEM27_10510 [Metarhizobium album]|uniref:Uncharacterized protein n=1 Tax=Metarhizobium album TaxID=2182425 RepID=A0A2U2DU06_9HYPH|nr:hypothetical protein [Rhizobium album]PWE56786.1 hypothetical protein DEM27_10510 [Rhizobium album]
MIYQDRDDEELLRVMRKAEIGKTDWLGRFARGPNKRPDDNIRDQREYAEVFDQICRKLERSISLRTQKHGQQRDQSLPTTSAPLPQQDERNVMRDENRGYRFGGQAR